MVWITPSGRSYATGPTAYPGWGGLSGLRQAISAEVSYRAAGGTPTLR
jgi:hypothetical protein